MGRLLPVVIVSFHLSLSAYANPGLADSKQRAQDLREYRCCKRYIARNPRVLNGYSYQFFSQIAAQSDPI